MNAIEFLYRMSQYVQNEEFAEYLEVREKFAELIEAAKGATEEKVHDGASSKAACDRLISALAKVEGDKL